LSKVLLTALAAIVLMMSLAAVPASAAAPPGAEQIKHIVFILKENHTLDNYFGTFPGADGVTSGLTHSGRVVPLGPAPNFFTQDIGHSFGDAMRAMDKGKMDHFDLIGGAVQDGRLVNYTQFQES
jgi:phospholipase C